MGRLTEWWALRLPAAFSGWLLAAVRRPLRFLLVLVAAPLVFVLVGSYAVNVTTARRQALRNLRVTAALAAGLIEETLGETLLLEQLLAGEPDFAAAVAAADAPALASRLTEALALVPSGDVAAVISLQGRVIAAVPDAGMTGRNVSFHEAFTGARAAGWQPYISPVYLREPVQAEKVIGISAPVRHGDAVAGLVQVQYRVDAIRERLQRVRVEPDGFVYVVDQSDQLVTYPFQVLPGRPKVASSWPPVAQPAGPDGATLRFLDPRTRQSWLAGVYPVGATGWRVIAVQPDAAAQQPLQRMLWPLAAVLGVLAALIALIGWQWSQVQAASLRLLQQNTSLLKQLQQQRTFGKGQPPPPPPSGPGEGAE